MSGISPEYNTKNYDSLKNVNMSQPAVNKGKLERDNTQFYWYGWIWLGVTIILIIGLILYVAFYFVDRIDNVGLWFAVIFWLMFIGIAGVTAGSFKTDYERTKALLENYIN